MRTFLLFTFAALLATPALAQVTLSTATLPDDAIDVSLTALSHDGTTAVGAVRIPLDDGNSSRLRAAVLWPAFIWLPEPAEGPLLSIATGASDGGRVVGVTSYLPTFVSVGTLVVDGSLLTLPRLAGTVNSQVTVVSADGHVVFGECDGQLCRWLVSGAAVSSPTVVPAPASAESASISACTPDGAIAAGVWSQGDTASLFAWSAGGGAADRGAVAGVSSLRVNGLSDDGEVMAVSYVLQSYRAAVWTAAGGLVTLAHDPAAFPAFDIATGCSADGRTIVGASGATPVVWVDGNPASVVDRLGAGGVDLSTWARFSYAADTSDHWPRISGDAGTIAGVGQHQFGPDPSQIRNELWIAHFPPACGTADYNGDGDSGTDADIEAFFACLSGHCCPACYLGGADFNADGDSGTDADIESFFRVLAGGPC